MSAGQLLFQRRFWPFFWVAFLTSFNDNIFKQALIVLVTVRGLTMAGMSSEMVQLLAPAIIILPFVLASAIAGQVSDRQPKAYTIRWVKLAEIPVMAIGAYGLLSENTSVMMATLFLTGLQSTFFGPAKYSFLPEVVEDDALVGGNGLVEMGTFVSVLCGTILGGILAGVPGIGAWLASAVCLAVAVMGAALAWLVPVRPAAAPDLSLSLDPIRPNIEILRATAKERPVFLAVLAISWFWLFGAAFLSLVPPYVNTVLRADVSVITYCVALFSVGVAVGSVLCERLGGGQLELGLVPFGSFGMSLFALDLLWVGQPAIPAGLHWTEFASTFVGARISLDLTMIAMFGGFFTVPLYTVIQQRTDPTMRARVIAGNNILNSIFIIAAAGLLIGLRAAGLSIPAIFGVLAAANLLVALYVYHLLPEFMLRFVAWGITRVMYRLAIEGREHIPREGGVILAANHVTYADFLLVASASPRPPRFVMWYRFFQLPFVGWIFRDARVIPIASRKDDPAVLEHAYAEIGRALDAGEVVCIFPEGALTRDGALLPFRPGLQQILANHPVPVVPMAIRGMWGSFFSHSGKGAFRQPFGRVRSRVALVIGPPLAPEGLDAQRVGERIAELGEFSPPPPASPANPTPAATPAPARSDGAG